MTDYTRDILHPGQRLSILQALRSDHDGRLNEHDLGRWLDLYGYRVSRDELRARLRELADRDVIRLQFPGDVIMVAEITRRGEDHLDRRGPAVEGIALPPRS
jgi:repressor of nif and glnA expression